ncbi:MAG: hypothetical protein ACUVWP_05960 [bacterium]
MIEKGRLRILASTDVIKDKICVLLVNNIYSDAEIRYISNYFTNELNIRFEKIILISISEETIPDNISSEKKDNNIITVNIDNLIENIVDILPKNISAVVDATKGMLINWSYRKALAIKILDCGVSYIGSDFAFFPRKSRIESSKPLIEIYGLYDSIGVQTILISSLRLLDENNRTSCIIKLTDKEAPHPRIVDATNIKSSKELLNIMRYRGEEDHELILESNIIGSKIIGCISVGDGITGKTFYTLIDDSLILANSFNEQILFLETLNIIKPISTVDLSILSISNNIELFLEDEILLESKLSNIDIVFFTQNICDNLDKNRYRKIKRKLKEITLKTIKFIDTVSIPVITKDISKRNTLIIKKGQNLSQ